MNHYTKLIENPVTTMTKLDFVDRIHSSPEELEMFLLKTKTRILREISALDSNDERSEPLYAQQIELIKELNEYGFEAEAIGCLTIMQARIMELTPTLRPWLNLHLKEFGVIGLTKRLETKAPIFIETFYEHNNVLRVTWCVDGDQNSTNPNWHDSALLGSDLLKFARDLGLNTVVIDEVYHAGQHIQKEMKRPMFNHVQENIELFIKQYIQAGRELVEL